MPSKQHLTFSFPTGVTLGGSNIWSLYMLKHLVKLGVPVAGIVHRNTHWHPPLENSWPSGVKQVKCPGRTADKAGCFSRWLYRGTYSSQLPAVFIPNFSDSVYRICSDLVEEAPERATMVSVLHGDCEGYYEPAVKYEQHISLFIAVNEKIGNTLQKALPHRKDHIVVRSCPVECPNELNPRRPDPSRPLRITYAGRITNHEKRVGSLPALATKLVQHGVGFQLRIIGEGGYKQHLMYEVSQLPDDIKASINIEDAISPFDMGRVWEQSDIGILVSDREGTPLSMLEAMAHGCAVVMPDLEGIAAVVTHGENGRLYPVDDMESMANEIAALDRDRDLLNELGQEAHKLVKAQYSYEQYVPWFLGLVEELC